MASQSRKYRGFSTERYISQYLQQWWPSASVGRGADPQGDILNVPFDIEIKSRNKLDIPGTLRQIRARTSKSGKLGFACFRLNGMGEQSVGEHIVMLTLSDMVELLIKAGYTDPHMTMSDLNPVRCPRCGEWMIEGAPCYTCMRMDKANDTR